MAVGAGLYTYDVVVKKFMFAISSPDVVSDIAIFVLKRDVKLQLTN